jgi:hypothetical protein
MAGGIQLPLCAKALASLLLAGNPGETKRILS